MRTSKPIATISYNTEDFLKARLEELHKNHTIDDYIYIHHDAEEDEAKDHFHVWVSPNKLLDTMVLQETFNELDPRNPAKPLKCMPFRSSSQDDWILYSMHLQAYLLSKGQTRTFVYNKCDFRYCDEDTFDEAYRHALHGSEWAHRDAILQLVREGQYDPAKLIIDGIVPLQQATYLNSLLNMQGKTFRNGRPDHEIRDDAKAPDRVQAPENSEKPPKPKKPVKSPKSKGKAIYKQMSIDDVANPFEDS